MAVSKDGSNPNYLPKSNNYLTMQVLRCAMSLTDSADGQIAAVRAFNRFYTRKLGVLDQQLLKSPFLLSDARVIYELAHREEPAARSSGRTRARSRLPQPHPPEIRRSQIVTRKPLQADRRQYRLASDRQGPPGLRRAGPQLARRRRRLLAAFPPATARGRSTRWPPSNGCSATAGVRLARDPARSPPRRHGLGGAEPRRALCPRIRF